MIVVPKKANKSAKFSRGAISTHIVAKTLVFDQDGNLLVLKRSLDDAHRAGGMDFPGGQVDDGEPVAEGAARELYEEAGLQLDGNSLQLCFASSKIVDHAASAGRVNLVWLGFITAMPVGQSIQLSHEHAAYCWLSLDDFLDLTDHPAHHKLIRYLRDNRIAEEIWKPHSKPSQAGGVR